MLFSLPPLYIGIRFRVEILRFFPSVRCTLPLLCVYCLLCVRHDEFSNFSFPHSDWSWSTAVSAVLPNKKCGSCMPAVWGWMSRIFSVSLNLKCVSQPRHINAQPALNVMCRYCLLIFRTLMRIYSFHFRFLVYNVAMVASSTRRKASKHKIEVKIYCRQRT